MAIKRLGSILMVLFIGFWLSVGTVLADPMTTDEQQALNAWPNWVADNGAGCGLGSISSTLPNNIPEPYRTLFTQAAGAFKTNPQFLAALFLTENGNVWKPFDTSWPSSTAGASGPFQFMPGTWATYATDGNNDGKEDINNMYDAAYTAANMISSDGAKIDTPLGDINKPFAKGTFLYESAVYNWGSGNVQIQTTPSSPLTVAPVETQEYLKNVYALITSGFTKGDHVGYGNPTSQVGSSGGATASGASAGNGCSGGVVSGSIVQTALNFAWDTIGHGPNDSDAKSTYRTAMPKYNGSTGDQPFSDCGVFVSTVMIASGADPNYPKRSTIVQIPYLQQHKDLYQEFDNVNNTSQLKPGDVLINSQHTYIYTGPQSNGYNAVAASLNTHVPQPSPTYFSLGGEHFMVFRLTKQGGQ